MFALAFTIVGLSCCFTGFCFAMVWQQNHKQMLEIRDRLDKLHMETLKNGLKN